MKYVTILCCINPSINTSDITEYTFYRILNSYAEIKNVKMISKDGQVKAFVQVSNHYLASKLIETVDNSVTNCGTLQMYLSHKKYISFDRTMKQIISDADGIVGFVIYKSKDLSTNVESPIDSYTATKNQNKDKFTESHRAGDLPLDKIKDRTTDQAIIDPFNFNSKNFNNYQKDCIDLVDESKSVRTKELKIFDSIRANDQTSRSFTSNSIISLKVKNQKKLTLPVIVNIFSIFGEVKNIWFNSKNNCYKIEYEEIENMWDAIYHLNSLEIFGERVLLSVSQYNSISENESSSIKYCKGSKVDSKLSNSKYSLKEYKPTTAYTLIVSSSVTKITIEMICLLFAAICYPRRISEMTNLKGNKIVYLVGLDNLSQCVESIGSLNGKVVLGETLQVSFSDISQEILASKHF